MSNRISFFGNPFYIQGVIWIFVGSIYSLGWSDLYPKISSNLTVFLCLSVFIYFLLGYYCQRKRYFAYYNIHITNKQVTIIKKSICSFYILLGIEIFFTSFPLWSFLTTGETGYTDFGLPFIHVAIVAGFTIICWFSFHCLLCSRCKRTKYRLKKYIILSILPFILIFNRGGIMTILLGMGFLYLMAKRINTKTIFCSVAISLFIFWGFGYLGDKRIDLNNDQHLILELGKASDGFKNSVVPPEFFWTYIYITSPLGNIQYNIDQTRNVSYNLWEMVLFDFTPQIISKRVASNLNLEERKPHLVVQHLNVCTVYKNSYNYLGWIGFILMFIFSIVFVFITLGFANRKSPLYDTLLVSVNVIVAMNLFDNMFIFMGLVPIPFFLLILSRKFTIKNSVILDYRCSNNTVNS